MSTTVTYASDNGPSIVLNPAPFVSQSRQPIDAGGLRLGQIEEYELNGVGSDDIGSLSKKFEASPGTLTVDGLIIKDLYLTSISIPQNNHSAIMIKNGAPNGMAIPYKIKFKKFSTGVKIKSPSFEFNFTQNENKSVGLSVKAAAVGLESINDAQGFVEGLLGGFDPVSFAPGYITINDKWSLLSNKKTVDRSKFSFQIEKNYICNPKGFRGDSFLETTTVSDISNINDDYKVFKFDSVLRLLTEKNYARNISFEQAENEFANKNYIQKISEYYAGMHGINFGNSILSNVSISKNSEAQEIKLSWELLVGESDSDFKGFFDYSVSAKEDLSLQEISRSLEGSFVSKGDITSREEFLKKWIESNFTPHGANQQMPKKDGSADYIEFAKNLTSFTDGFLTNPLEVFSINATFNDKMANFEISCTEDNKPRISPGSEMNFSVNVQNSIKLYKFLQAANIEGHYIIQDLECTTAEKSSLKVDGKADSAIYLENFLGTGVKIMGDMFQHAVGGLPHYREVVPQDLQVSKSEIDGKFSIEYNLLHKENKPTNHGAFKRERLNAPPSSTRKAYLFGR